MKINLTISNGLTPEANSIGRFIPSSVAGIKALELFFIDGNHQGVIYKSMIRVPFFSEFLNDQDVLLVKKIAENKFSFEKIEGFSLDNKLVIIMQSRLYGYLHENNLHCTPSLFAAPIINEMYDSLTDELSLISIEFDF
ncbi:MULTISPECIES: hypothetical protein [Pantoea]|uniref:Uncharacterized protein n=1 Tax=Pantoea allii TaxID=574096 RepID=A0ABS6VE52_9GAMM|nr:hypothetical protein [Pantoea allii]MBW1214321.1 hypothetical protein [Pantoea allii]MBW1257603.1 hypothetical protein [Pantoea allii]MBW1266614.1 hypothetical protein [Pantoea allii]MBW1288803.1 hypothetical protein [Pantoea allii]